MIFNNCYQSIRITIYVSQDHDFGSHDHYLYVLFMSQDIDIIGLRSQDQAFHHEQ